MEELQDELLRVENTLCEDMEDTKEKLICAIEDNDFNNFLRYTTLLRQQWCKASSARENRERLQKRIKDAELRERRRVSRSRYYEKSYSTPGGDNPRKYERDRNPNDYARQRGSPKEFYTSRYNQGYSLRSSFKHNQSPPPSPTEENYRPTRESYGRKISYGGVRASPRREFDEF